MQNQTNINPQILLDDLDGLDDDAILQVQATLERRVEDIRTRKKAAFINEANSKIKFFGVTLADLHALAAADQMMKAKRSVAAAKYYDPVSGAHWVGSGNTKKEFKAAYDFDAANPNASVKHMDQYLIRDHEAKEIALKIKKNVRTVSHVVVNYADLNAETSGPHAEKMAA